MKYKNLLLLFIVFPVGSVFQGGKLGSDSVKDGGPFDTKKTNFQVSAEQGAATRVLRWLLNMPPKKESSIMKSTHTPLITHAKQEPNRVQLNMVNNDGIETVRNSMNVRYVDHANHEMLALPDNVKIIQKSNGSKRQVSVKNNGAVLADIDNILINKEKLGDLWGSRLGKVMDSLQTVKKTGSEQEAARATNLMESLQTLKPADFRAWQRMQLPSFGKSTAQRIQQAPFKEKNVPNEVTVQGEESFFPARSTLSLEDLFLINP